LTPNEAAQVHVNDLVGGLRLAVVLRMNHGGEVQLDAGERE
jgi:hypothetical protein